MSRPTQEDFDRYAQGHKNRVYAIPIIEDMFHTRVVIGDPDDPMAIIGPAPDRVVGIRFYAETNGVKTIYETRAQATSDYNLFKMWYRDWAETDVLRRSIDASDRIDGDDFHGSFTRRKEQQLLDQMRSPDA